MDNINSLNNNSSFSRNNPLNNNNSFSNNNNSFNNIVNYITEIDAEGHQILQWLSPLEPQQRHQGVRTNRLNGVGNWVIETSEFRKWRDADDGCVEPVLFCYGNPGVGKTYISSLAIDSLCDQAGKDFAVVGIYCDFYAKEEQSTTNMLGAMLKQLASRGGITEHMREAFRKAKKEFGGRGLLLPDMIDILKKEIASLSRVFICIDGLDESTAQRRRELLESMQEIVRVSPNARVFLTGRPHIDHEIVKCFIKAIRIPISPTDADIKSYLEMRLDGDTDPDAMDGKLRADIIRIVLEKISESFLLVSLNIDSILGEITLTRRRKKLNYITSGEGLEAVYAATLSRMGAQPKSRSKLGVEVLMWVSHSERPLYVEELCHALGVEESIDLDIGNIPSIETLLACSQGLVTVEKSSSTVRLVHYTLQEYLSHNPNLFLRPHSMIAEVCLTYLNFPHVRGISPTLRSVPRTAPFIEYASCHWGTHSRLGTTESVVTLALKLLDEYDKHISSKILLLRGLDHYDRPFDLQGTPKGFTGLHGAAYFGCVEITVALLETKKWNVRATDFRGHTAIAWAARRGHEGVVRALIEGSDVDPDIVDTECGRTPLWWAARYGHGGVARMLLERSVVNPNKADWLGQIPLSLAAQNGHEGVMKVLLERDSVNPGRVDKWGKTPLWWAASNGHEGVVRMLLERNDVNADIADTESGRTPFSAAARNGHQEVVRMLLERNDVSPDKADKWCQTPLSWAARNGHEGVVRMLLERNDVNADTPDTEYRRTPLLWAANNGHEGVMRMLLKRNDINPNTPNTEYGRTPLLWAAMNGHEGVMRMLLERHDANADMPDTEYGRTPLLWAALSGHEGIAKILLERNDVNPNTVDAQYCRTPLSWAAEGGHEGFVRMLLERNDVNADTPDTEYGRTPLMWAANNGHEGVMRMLLERNDVNPDTPDPEYGRTPLLWAALSGREGVLKMLLERNNVNPNKADRCGQTPLSLAAQNEHEGVVRVLLERNDVSPDKADKWSQTPLSLAAQNGDEGVVRMLLNRNDVDPAKKDKIGLTPHSWAVQKGHARIAKLLEPYEPA